MLAWRAVDRTTRRIGVPLQDRRHALEAEDRRLLDLMCLQFLHQAADLLHGLRCGTGKGDGHHHHQVLANNLHHKIAYRSIRRSFERVRCGDEMTEACARPA